MCFFAQSGHFYFFSLCFSFDFFMVGASFVHGGRELRVCVCVCVWIMHSQLWVSSSTSDHKTKVSISPFQIWPEPSMRGPSAIATAARWANAVHSLRMNAIALSCSWFYSQLGYHRLGARPWEKAGYHHRESEFAWWSRVFDLDLANLTRILSPNGPTALMMPPAFFYLFY